MPEGTSNSSKDLEVFGPVCFPHKHLKKKYTNSKNLQKKNKHLIESEAREYILSQHEEDLAFLFENECWYKSLWVEIL